MTREEELHIAEQIKDYLCTGNPIWDVDMIAEAMDAAIEALKFRGAYEIAVKAANKAFENRWTQWVEWIPCSERLPEEKQVVLITNGKSHVRCGQYQGLAFRDSDPTKWWWKNKTIETVIAWMPLPKPYQEDKQ